MGVLDMVMKEGVAVPMTHRAIHGPKADSAVVLQAYGTHKGQAINSISRSLINSILLTEAERLAPLVELNFEAKVVSVTAEGVVTVEGANGSPRRVIHAQVVVGADGAYSYVRNAMMRMKRVNFSQHFIDHGYKELEIPPGPDGDFQLTPVNALHIWPRHEFMMIALPNPDKTFTCTLFAPFAKFEELDAAGAGAVEEFMLENFPDAVPLLPDVAKQYTNNPTGALVTMRVNPWNVSHHVVLCGDAAHACVPFYGQGMNAGLEDTLVFAETLDKNDGDFTKAVPEYAAVRRPAGDGITDLSYGNYMEMRSHVASPMFRLQKQVEAVLHRLFPSLWMPLYSMVAFTRIPYHEALALGKRQDAIIKRFTWLLLTAVGVGGAVFAAKRFNLVKL